MKRSILFCCYGLGMGGIEKCMINLLNELDTEKYEIDVLPMNPCYDLLPLLHGKVTILNPFDYVMNTTDTAAALKHQGLSLNKIIKYVKYVMFRFVNKWGYRPWRLFCAPVKEYDIAVAYAHVGYVPYYVIDCVNAKKKYMWHHEGRYLKGRNYNLDKEYFPKFDSIVAVSKDDKKVLLEAFPELKNSIKVIYNIVPYSEIISKSCESIELIPKTDKIKITTVGRLTKQKGPDILVDVAIKLKKANIPFVWYWIGDGDQKNYMQSQIKKNNLSDDVILWGNQTNPYPFIKWCDIYVQPSYYEAFCTTTMEAQVLEKPIIVTDVCGMHEQFINGYNGIIVPINSQEIFQQILALANNPIKRKALSENAGNKIKNYNNVINDYYYLFDQ